jgi:hypothetical protein
MLFLTKERENIIEFLKLYVPIANNFFFRPEKKPELDIYEAVEREKRCLCCFKHNSSVIN